MSTSKELEELQNKRARMEEESRSLNDEQKNLAERMQVLEEKVAIAELTKNNKAAREQISQLESKINELDQKLSGYAQTSETSPMMETPPEPEEVAELVEEEVPAEQAETIEPEEPQEEIVTVAEFESPVQQEEFGDDMKKRSDKKKRKFF